METSVETPDDGDYEPVAVADSIDELMESFAKRFNAVMEDARQYGLTTVVGICAHDVLDCQGWRSFARKGNYYAAIGMLDLMRDEFKGE
jgi:hypothetical protein